MIETEIRKKVSVALQGIKTKRKAYTFVSKSEYCQIVNNEIMQFLINKNKYSGIYVTLNKAHCDTVKRLESKKIETKNILFIDNQEKECGANNCIFIGNKSLTALSLAMSEACKSRSMEFIFFDSVTTLLIYNKVENVERFIHFFLNKIKNLNILMVIMSVEEEKTEKIIPILEQFCEGCIRI